MVDQLAEGMVLKPAVKYQNIAQTNGRSARQPLSGIKAHLAAHVARFANAMSCME